MTNVVSGFLITDRMLGCSRPIGEADRRERFIIADLHPRRSQAAEPSISATSMDYRCQLPDRLGPVRDVLKWMNHPTTARRSVAAGELGMILAMAGTLLALSNDPVLKEPHLPGATSGDAFASERSSAIRSRRCR